MGPEIYWKFWRRPNKSYYVRIIPWFFLFLVFDFHSWGESSGAISVALQMVTNGGDTEGLFRAAFMQSGSPSSPVPVGSITDGQICMCDHSFKLTS